MQIILSYCRGIHSICVKKLQAASVKKEILSGRSEFISFSLQVLFLAPIEVEILFGEA
jgi:hypothetical protein